MSRYLPAVAVTVLLSFCLCSALKAQSEPTPFSDFVKHLPDSQTEIFAVHNIGGHVESILRNKALTRAIEEGKIAEMMGATGNQVDMDDAIDWLAENRKYFPHTAAISLPPDSYVTIVDLFHLMMLLNIAETTNYTDDFDVKELARLEDEIKKIARDFKLPVMTVWIQWPEEETTKGLYEIFKQGMAVAGLSTELEFTQEEGSFMLSGLIADVDQDGLINQVLAGMGIADKDNEITNAILNIEILVRCERFDNGMRISIGSDPRNKKIKSLALANVKDGSSEIAYGQWNMEKLLTAAEQFEEDMDRWADTDLGKLYRSNDLEDVWGSMARFTEQAKLIPAKGQMRVWAVENQVRAKLLSQGVPEVESLIGKKILTFVPADIESYYVDSNYNLGELVFGILENAEERLATRSLQSDLKGDFENAETIDDLSLSYYEHFGPFRNLLVNELAKIDSRPMAMVMDTKGSLKLPHFEMETDNLVRMAAVAACENPEQYQQKIMEAYEKFVGGVLSLNELELPDDTELFQDGTLPNGTKIKVLSLDWLDETELLELEFEADFDPHVFTLDGHVILSSSLKFSESLLAARKESLKLPKPENLSSITSHGHFKGKTIGNLYGVLMEVITAALLELRPERGLSQDAIGDAFAEFGGLMNHLQWTTEQDGKNSDSTFVLDFKN